MIDIWCWSERPAFSRLNVFKLMRDEDDNELYWGRMRWLETKESINMFFPEAFYLKFDEDRFACLKCKKIFCFPYQEGDLEFKNTTYNQTRVV